MILKSSTYVLYCIKKATNKKNPNKLLHKNVQLIKESGIVVYIFNLIKKYHKKNTHPSSGAVVMEIHQCACVAHSPFSCINKHPGEMAGPPNIITASSPLEPARLVPAFPYLGWVTPTLQ